MNYVSIRRSDDSEDEGKEVNVGGMNVRKYLGRFPEKLKSAGENSDN